MTLVTESFFLDVTGLLIWLSKKKKKKRKRKEKKERKLRKKTRNMLNRSKVNIKDILLVLSRFRYLVYSFTLMILWFFFPYAATNVFLLITISSSYIACIATNGLLLWKLKNSFKSVKAYTVCDSLVQVFLIFPCAAAASCK